MKDRIEILKETGIITEVEEKQLYKIIEELEKYEIKVDDDNLSGLITHIAMMLQRGRLDEMIQPMDIDGKEEIRAFNKIDMAIEIIEKISKIIAVPTEEKWYVLLHLCTLIESEGI